MVFSKWPFSDKKGGRQRRQFKNLAPLPSPESPADRINPPEEV